jgi:hypothetical protein
MFSSIILLYLICASVFKMSLINSLKFGLDYFHPVWQSLLTEAFSPFKYSIIIEIFLFKSNVFLFFSYQSHLMSFWLCLLWLLLIPRIFLSIQFFLLNCLFSYASFGLFYSFIYISWIFGVFIENQFFNPTLARWCPEKAACTKLVQGRWRTQL